MPSYPPRLFNTHGLNLVKRVALHCLTTFHQYTSYVLIFETRGRLSGAEAVGRLHASFIFMLLNVDTDNVLICLSMNYAVPPMQSGEADVRAL